MKIKIYNDDKIKECDITDKVIRVKAIMINSKKEILLGEAFGTLQFPGGHLENNETLSDGLVREVKEETGIVLEVEHKPFFAIKYFLRDYPEVGNNRSIEIYYFYILTDEEYHMDLVDLDSQERKGGFKLRYVPLKELKKELKRNEKKNSVNKVVNREMLLAIKELRKWEKF